MTGLDVLLIIYIALGALSGFWAGLIRMVVALGGLLGSWLIAAFFTGRAVALADARWDVIDRLAAFASKYGGFGADHPVVTDLRALIMALPLPPALQEALLEAVQRSALLTAGQAGDAAGLLNHLLAQGLANILAFTLLFVLARAAFAVLATALEAVIALSPLALVNRLAGAGLGLVRNAAIATLALGLITPVAVLFDQTWFMTIVQRSTLASRLLDVFHTVSPWLLR
ncbi:MAG TPA: CvpA family protein [Bacillota bacterium]